MAQDQDQESQFQTSLRGKTLAEIQATIDAQEGSESKPKQQRRLTAFFLANHEFAAYMFDQMQQAIPPIVLNMIGKMLPGNLKPSEWWRLPIDGVYSMEPLSWNAFRDFVNAAVAYMEGETSTDEHSSGTGSTRGVHREDGIGKNAPSVETDSTPIGNTADLHIGQQAGQNDSQAEERGTDNGLQQHSEHAIADPDMDATN